MLLHAGEISIDAQIPPGMRVVPVPVNPEAIHSGLVQPGARCDVQVFIRADSGLGIGETTSKTILQDIRVFAVNDITSNQSNDPKSPDAHSLPAGKTVSLLVTPPQADIVTLASQLGSIRLILRSAEDSVQIKSKPLSARELLGGGSTANRDLENSEEKNVKEFGKWFAMMKAVLKSNAAPSRPSPLRPEEPAKYTMRVRLGADSSDVLMIANAGANGFLGDDATWTAMNLPTQSKPSPEGPAAKAVEALPVVNSALGPAAKPQGETPQPVLNVNGKPPLGG
jgi:pilus assembly protein CpaB